MITPRLPVGQFSARTRICLVSGGRCYPVAKMGPYRLVLREGVEADLDAGEAEVVMTVDEREHRWPVMLTDGAVPYEPEVHLLPLW